MSRRVPLNRKVSDPDTLVSWVVCADCGQRHGSNQSSRECCETPWERRYVQPARLAPEWAYEGDLDQTTQTTLADISETTEEEANA